MTGRTPLINLAISTALAGAIGPARIVDGDTLDISGRKVRLLDMDAPDGDGQQYMSGLGASKNDRSCAGTR